MKFILKKSDIFYLEKIAPFKIINSNQTEYYFEKQNGITNNDYLKVYKKIGSPWNWSGRLLISSEELSKTINSEHTHIYFLKKKEETIGYFELQFSNNEVELVYFGIDANIIGKGLGRLMMNEIFRIIAQNKASRIWLHTCSFDSPKALGFYQYFGFEIYKTTTGFEKHIIE